MKKCPKCENIYHDYYKKCVNCGEDTLTQLKYTPLEEDEAVSVSPFVECGEIKGEEL